MSSDNKKEGVNKIGINWASHIYANNFIIGKKLKLVYKKSIIKNNSKILVYKRREEF